MQLVEKQVPLLESLPPTRPIFKERRWRKDSMTHEAFNDYQAKLLAEVVGMGATKGREYSHSDDRFANFNRLSEALGIPNYRIGWIYAMKHKDGIESYVKYGKEYSTEGVRGRIVDLITYLTLIGGMIEEKGLGKGIL
jgi:hypothetical protein